MEPVVRWHNDRWRVSAYVYPYGEDGDGGSTYITVYRERRLVKSEGSLDTKASINWQALGAKSIDDADQFNLGLSIAVMVAREMERPMAVYIVDASVATSDDDNAERDLVTVEMVATSIEQIVASVRGNAELVGIRLLKEVNDGANS